MTFQSKSTTNQNSFTSNELIASTAKIKKIIQLALDNRKEPAKAMNYIDEAIGKAKEDNNKEQLATALDIKGGLYWFECNFAQASEQMQLALKIWQTLENKDKIAESHNNIGTIYYNTGNYKKALHFYLTATQYKEELNDHLGLSRCYFNIAVLYAKREFYQRALDYHSKALAIRQELKDTKGITASLISLAGIYKQLEHFKLSIDYYKEALYLLESSENEYMLSQVYYEMGEAYNRIDDFHLGLDYLLKALKLLEQKPYQADLAVCLLKIGRAYVQIKKYEAAIQILERSLNIMNQIDLQKCLDEVYYNMAKAYAELGEYEKSNQYLWKYTHFITKSYQNEKTKAIIEIETKYATQKKEREIEALSRTQTDLRHQNQELYEFAGKAAHDLKEPLRMVGSFSGLFYRRYSQNIDEQGKEFLDIIQDAVTRMNQLVTNLLHYAKAGKNHQNIQQVDLNEVLNTTLQNLQLTIDEKQAIIEVGELPTITANLTNMIQLFQNLIGNGLKFKKANVPPIIKLTVERQEKSYLFRVKDNGIGIEDENQERIFQAFDRLHSKTEYEGTGLGLAICKKIVTGLGGKIWVESEFGNGTCFCFTLPV
ncbi:MAG: tetratricopeptide repeat protein [Chitinophagales bacterium]